MLLLVGNLAQIQGTLLMGVHISKKAPQWRRNLIQRMLSPLQLSFSVVDVRTNSRIGFLKPLISKCIRNIFLSFIVTV